MEAHPTKVIVPNHSKEDFGILSSISKFRKIPQFDVLDTKKKLTKLLNNSISLTKLNVIALKLDLTTPLLVCQKFIKKKDDKPINSQPKKIVKKFPENTRVIILSTNEFNQNKNRLSSPSPLK